MSSRTLTLPGDLNALEPIGDLVVEYGHMAGLDHKAAYQLRLAVDEIATNIIIHGYQEHAVEGEISITASLDERALTIVLEDCSPKFDPMQRDIARVEADFSKTLEERQIGGLGIYFAIKAVDDYRYEYQDGRNRNIFVVCRPTVAAHAGTESAESRS